MAKKVTETQVEPKPVDGAGPPHVDLAAENARLLAELATAKATLKAKREEYCLRELQGVLDEHHCQLVATPDGRFAVLVKE